MSVPTPDHDRIEELLAARALGELESAEAAELDRYLLAHGDDDSYDLLAASLDLAMAPSDFDDAPESVKRSLYEAAEAFLLDDADSNTPLGFAPPARLGSGFAIAGWLAAAACLTLAVLVWTPGAGGVSPPDFASVSAAPSAITVGLSADLAGEQPIGTLVWDGESQRGVMRFEGLAALDPAEDQYQLWIFDGSREPFEHPLDIKHPVDGGVFDIPAGQDGVVEIPIDAKIPVGRPVLFAVTIEPPGGVVVSDRSRIAAVGIPG